MREFEFILYVTGQKSNRGFYRALFNLKPEPDVPGMTEFRITENVKLRSIILFVLLFFSIPLFSQNNRPANRSPEITIGGFADIYYAYDFNNPGSSPKLPFFYNYNRQNEFNLNLALVRFNLLHPAYRATIGLQTGTYAEDNYAAEQGMLKNVNEAKIGISLNTENTLWLDAGIMNSHIGFESVVSMDDLTLTRSIGAENSPYFLTGVKLTYDPDEDWTFLATVCNGWQRIQRAGGNTLPSFGTQVNYHPSGNLTLNWSTFIGTDDPDSTRRMRYFNDFYGIFRFGGKISLIAGFDFGFQQKTPVSAEYDYWLNAVLIGQYAFSERWQSALRVEYYDDKSGIIIPVSVPGGFQTAGASLNLDYLPHPDLACRVEARWLKSKEKIFEREDGSYSDNNFFITASIAVKFNR